MKTFPGKDLLRNGIIVIYLIRHDTTLYITFVVGVVFYLFRKPQIDFYVSLASIIAFTHILTCPDHFARPDAPF